MKIYTREKVRALSYWVRWYCNGQFHRLGPDGLPLPVKERYSREGQLMDSWHFRGGELHWS